MQSMKALVLGSINIDKTYSVARLAHPGEPVHATSLKESPGGKGLNQAVSLKRAGLDVYIAGCVGADGNMPLELLKAVGVNTDNVLKCAEPTGHAIIQVDSDGLNNIIVFGGANRLVTTEMIDRVLDKFNKGDLLVLQNEISNTAYAIQAGAQRGLKVVFNPSPLNKEVLKYPIGNVSLLILNETESEFFGGRDRLCSLYPNTEILITLGDKGSIFVKNGKKDLFCPAFSVTAKDTTGAGDTYTGFCLAGIAHGMDIAAAMRFASAAAALSATKAGAAESVPTFEETEHFLNNYK